MPRPLIPFVAVLLALAGCEGRPIKHLRVDGGSVAPRDLAIRLGPGAVRAGVIREASELLAGPKADGRVGDIKLYNSHVAFVVEGVRAVGGYRQAGGQVVDAEPLDGPDGGRGELFGELIPT